jgi:DNA polymerase-3 subunit alpha
MYSLRDSIIKTDELVSRLQEICQGAVAITDHGTSLGGISIYKKLKENNLKYIHGCEMYICDDVSIKDKNNRYYHLIVLCINNTGRLNLNKLISESEHPDNFYYKPRIDFNMLCKYKDGLLVLSACMAGEISKHIEENKYDEAKKIALRYKTEFNENYYLEIQSHNDLKQIELNKLIYKLSQELDIQCVVTSDAHYVLESDRDYQNKYAFNGSYKEDGESYIDCFIQSEDDVFRRLTYFSESVVKNLINNTHVIADKCNVEMPLSAPIMPHIDTPKEFKNNREWLDSICSEGFKRKLKIETLPKDLQKIYVDRYEYEINSLERMGFLDYILLVYSYANIAKRRGIARGSAGGSLVCYLSNITNIDPIEHGLYFERFIDVGALDLLESGQITAKELKIPDIDLDFSGESCKEVLDFLYNKYGEENVASIGKFGTNQTKGTIRDLCKVFDIDLKTADLIAKSFDNYEIDEIDNILLIGDKPPSGATDAINYIQLYPKLFEYVRKLNGLPKSFGLHACGKVISTRPLDEYLPSCYDDNGVRYLQGDMHDVEDVGLVKIDVLGLRTLDQEYDTMEMTQEGIDYIDPKTQDYTDPKILDIFRKGDTVGIFQFSSYGMRDTLKKMNVSGIEDLSIANALYRPGAMAYINDFCKRRSGLDRFEYLHPDLEPILKNTYGIMVFQEQLIEIGRMAKIRNPDLLRKATGKKDPKLLAKVKPELEDNLKAKGWSSEQFDKLWSDMIEFSKYSFNKSHSSAYAIIGFITAKQKAYHPLEFYAGLCNSYIGKSGYVKDDADEIISDMLKHQIRFNPFNYKNDHRKCSVKNKKIIYAIPLIKECNMNVAEAVYNINSKNYKYFWEVAKFLYLNNVDKSQLRVLVKLDFFKDYANSKKLLRILDIFEYFKCGEAKSIAKDKVIDNEFLYRIISENSNDKGAKGDELKSFKITNMDNILNECENYIINLGIEDFTYKDKIDFQKEYLGFVSLVTGNEEDRPKLYVKRIYPAIRKSNGVQFGYNITAQSVGSGKETTYTIFNSLYVKQPINQGDLIYCDKYEQNGKYFNLVKYHKLI